MKRLSVVVPISLLLINANDSANQVCQVTAVALTPATIAALQRYRRLRNRHIVVTPETSFFVGSHGKYWGQRLRIHNVDRTFAGLRKQLGWVNRGAHHAPRIHDLRHYPEFKNMPCTLRSVDSAYS